MAWPLFSRYPSPVTRRDVHRANASRTRRDATRWSPNRPAFREMRTTCSMWMFQSDDDNNPERPDSMARQCRSPLGTCSRRRRRLVICPTAIPACTCLMRLRKLGIRSLFARSCVRVWLLTRSTTRAGTRHLWAHGRFTIRARGLLLHPLS